LTASANVFVGVAGWSYPDWKGYVYPAGVGDELRFVAGFLDMVEINSSFYRPPAAKTVASWVERTADLPGFFFSAKLHQDVTHKGVVDSGMVRAFHEGFAPMMTAGALKHLLAQFKWDFSDSPPARSHLTRVKESFGDMTHLTLELRHNSWQAPGALAFLTGLGVTVANLDYPLAHNSFSLPLCTVGSHAYLRLHGRNSKAWFSKGAGRDETYNYLYNKQEVEGIASRAADLAKMSASLTIVANNHYQGKEMANALQLKSLLSGRKVQAPAGLLGKYPELRECAETR